MANLEFKNICKSYGTNRVIENLSLEIKSGEFVTLLGPSGCGKTTLLRMIAGLEKIDGGELLINGKLMNKLPPQHRPIGMVFQSYALFPHMNVRNNIAFGLKVQKQSEAEIFEKLEWVLPLLGLEGFEKRLPKELSGGQRQRVALARSLVLDPEVLLLDEPLSNLDAALRELAMEELKRIHQKVGKTIVYVSHNQMEAMVMSQRIAVMNHGNVEQYDAPHKLYDAPATLFASQFIGSPSTNSYEGKIKCYQNSITVDLPMGELTLFPHQHVNWKAFDGMDVMACMRPQDISLVGAKGDTHKDPSLTKFILEAEMIETPGDRSVVVARSNNGDVTRFFVDRDASIKQGDLCQVAISGTRIHLFDKDSQKNILTM